MTLKELLGEAYKEGMTLEDIDTALQDKKLVDTARGEFVPLDKYLEADKQVKALKKENAELAKTQKSNSEQSAGEKNELLEEIARLTREVNKGRAEGILKGAGFAEEDYAEFIESLIGDDADATETRAKSFVSAMSKKIEKAQKDAESALKAKYLKEGVRLPGADGGKGDDGALGKQIAQSAIGKGNAAVDDIKKQYS